MSNALAAVTVARPFLWISLYAIGGWCWETIYCSLIAHKLVRRGFLFGPACPIYGAGAMLVWVTLGWIKDWYVMFIAGATIASVMEYATGWILEQLFHQRWWSYESLPLNIHGRICLASALLFGSFTLLVNLGLQPAIITLCDQLSANQQILLATAITIIFCIDLAASIIKHCLEANNERVTRLVQTIRRQSS
jgi:uncharacterized membrane protein